MKTLKFLTLFLLAALLAVPGYSQENSLKAGARCPDFSYQDINGKTYTLKDFAGKYVFLDVWATWCGPCKGEIPYLKELEKTMHGKNIVFVSLSVDKNKEQWENYVKQNDLAGVQLHNGGDRSLSNVFDIKYIPRFILIGPDGKVVDPNAMRPSEGDKLVKYLESLPGINK